MRTRPLLILVVILLFPSTSVISGFSPIKVHDASELFEKDGVVKRTALFKKALKKLGRLPRKTKKKLQQIDQLAETLCTLSIDTTLSTLDEIGHLAASFCCLRIATPQIDDYDDTAIAIATADEREILLPSYDDIIQYKQTPAEAIEACIKSCYERYLLLELAECFSLIEQDLERALRDFPSFTGSDSWHSALLYQLQRKILIQTSNYPKARTLIEKELTELDFTFIEAHDPSVIADYTHILECLDQSDFALDMLGSRVTAESRPYIRRHAALWRARHFTALEQLERAEEAYLDVVISSHCDPQAFSEFIGFLHNKKGDFALARAMVGIMNITVLDQNNWWGKPLADTDFKQYLQHHIPEEYRDYTGNADDLFTLGRYIASRDYLNEFSHLFGLFRLFTDKSGWFVHLRHFERSILQLVFEIPDRSDWRQHVSAEQTLRYFKTLYRDFEVWITGVGILGGEWAKRNFSAKVRDHYGSRGWFSFNSEIIKQSNNDSFAFAKYVVERDRQQGLTATRHAADMCALAMVVDHGISNKERKQAIEAFVDLCLQYHYEIASCTKDRFKSWLSNLVHDMSAEQRNRAIHNMIQNFAGMDCYIPELIIVFSENDRISETASALRSALAVNDKPVPLDEYDIDKIVGWLKGTRYSGPENFPPEIVEAWQNHPDIKEASSRLCSRKRLKPPYSARLFAEPSDSVGHPEAINRLGEHSPSSPLERPCKFPRLMEF